MEAIPGVNVRLHKFFMGAFSAPERTVMRTHILLISAYSNQLIYMTLMFIVNIFDAFMYHMGSHEGFRVVGGVRIRYPCTEKPPFQRTERMMTADGSRFDRYKAGYVRKFTCLGFVQQYLQPRKVR